MFEKGGFRRIRFGDITDEQVKMRGLPLNEDNERAVRESLRGDHGMAAYALLNLPRIDEANRTTDVIIDGLYSWEEYRLLVDRYQPGFKVVAVYASPETRYRRLVSRSIRGLTREDARKRDTTEIENLNKGGPIAMADFTIVNEATLAGLRRQTNKIISVLKQERA